MEIVGPWLRHIVGTMAESAIRTCASSSSAKVGYSNEKWWSRDCGMSWSTPGGTTAIESSVWAALKMPKRWWLSSVRRKHTEWSEVSTPTVASRTCRYHFFTVSKLLVFKMTWASLGDGIIASSLQWAARSRSARHMGEPTGISRLSREQ